MSSSLAHPTAPLDTTVFALHQANKLWNSQEDSASLDNFEKRTNAYLSLAASTGEKWFNEAGEWISPLHALAGRERLWLCFAFFRCGRVELANAVIRHMEFISHETPRGTTHFDIFESNIAVALLFQHSEAMATDVISKLESCVREGVFGDFPGDRSPDFQFHGYNDNMPAKATMGLILGGERLGNEAAFEHGLWNLRDFTEQLRRRGINSEFNSPTYTPLTVHALAEIASLAKHAESRQLAKALEIILWEDIAARFHPEMGVVAGPYSRAYTCDTLAHVSVLSSLLWFVLGDVVRPSPMLLFDMEGEGQGLVLHHGQDLPFNIAQMCWLAAGHYHLTDEIRALFENKSYPFEVRASHEQGNVNAGFPARDGQTTTRLERDWTLGSATTPFHSGDQSTAYFATYRRGANIESFRDLGTVYTKMVVNDDHPGMAPSNNKNAEVDVISSRAHSFAMQHEGAVLLVTQPYHALSSRNDISQISELLVFPSHSAGADEVLQSGSWFAFRRGQLLLGVRPIAYTREGKTEITLETKGNYEWLRAIFYKGEARSFTPDELDDMRGGFILEHASVEDYSSLQAFASELEHGEISDFYWSTRRVRYQRGVGDGATLEVAISAAVVAPRFATINGELLPTPHREWGAVKNTNQPAKPPTNRETRPWNKLEVWKMARPGVIGD